MSKPIQGARVLELGGLLAGPFATLILAHLGAEVIKVENIIGDPSRAWPNNYVAGNPGKTSIAIDLKRDEAQPFWRELLMSADVIICNLSDKAIEDLGVGYEQCRAVNPDIVYARICGYGEGPYQGRPATNPIVEAMTGLMSITWSDGKPARQGSSFYDQMAGILAALGALAALNRDDLSDGSGYVEIDLFETALFSVAPRLAAYSLNGALEGESFGTAPYGTFQASDGKWMYVGVLTDAQWRRFCLLFELDEAGSDPRYATCAQRLAEKGTVDEIAQGVLGRITREEALVLLDEQGIPAAPVLNFAEVLADEHVKHPGKLFLSEYEGKQLRLPALPIVGPAFAHGAPTTDAPRLGADTDRVLEALGFTPEDISQATDKGVLASAGDS